MLDELLTKPVGVEIIDELKEEDVLDMHRH